MELNQEIEALNGEIRIMMKKQEDLRRDINNESETRHKTDGTAIQKY